MPLPSLIPVPLQEEDICNLVRKWQTREDVVRKVCQGAQRLPFKVWIISGYRSREKQEALRAAGRPAADPDLSNHTSCPSTALDVRVEPFPAPQIKFALGEAMMTQGLRWGGGSPVDQDGIPSDWNHFDIGPRSTL